MHKPPDRRKHLLIDQLQYSLLKVNVVYFVVIVAAFISSLFGPLVLRLLLMNAPGGARERIAEQFLLIDDAIWFPLLVTFLGLITHSVFVSHRIAGPLVRLRRVLGAVGDGDLGVRVALRRKDYLGREQDVVNEMIDKLRASIGAAGSTTQDIRASLVGLRTAIATGSRGDVLDQLTALDERADQLDAALGHFTCRSNGPVAEPLPRHDEAASGSTVGNRSPSPGLAIADPQ